MGKLVDKLLSEESVILSEEEGMILPPEEKEKLWDIVEAQILKGQIHDVITIYLHKGVEKTDEPKEIEIYDSEEIYRFPYTEDKKWLEKGLKLAKEKSHSYNANRA